MNSIRLYHAFIHQLLSQCFSNPIQTMLCGFVTCPRKKRTRKSFQSNISLNRFWRCNGKVQLQFKMLNVNLTKQRLTVHWNDTDVTLDWKPDNNSINTLLDLYRYTLLIRYRLCVSSGESDPVLTNSDCKTMWYDYFLNNYFTYKWACSRLFSHSV